MIYRIITLFLCLLPLTFFGQPDEFRNFQAIAIQNDSTYLLTKNKLESATKNEDTLCAIKIIDLLHNKYHVDTASTIHWSSKCTANENSFSLVAQLLAKSFNNKKFYYFVAKELILLAKQVGLFEEEYRSIISYGSLAMLNRDTTKLQETIDLLEAFDFQLDTVKSFRKYLYYAELNKITKKESPGIFYQSLEDGLEKYIVLESDSSLMATSLRAYGDFFNKEGDLFTGAQKLIKAKNYFPNNPSYSLPKVQTYLELSEIYLSLKNNHMAKKYLDEAISVCDSQNYTKYKETRCTQQVSKILFSEGRYGEGLITLNKILDKYAIKTLNKGLGKTILLQISEAYIELDSLSRAKIAMEKADAIKITKDDIESYSNLVNSKYLTKKNQLNQALNISNENLTFCKDKRLFSHMPRTLYQVYLIHDAKGNNHMALNYLKSYHSFYDSLYQSGQQLGISELETQYEVGLSEEKINTLNAKNEIVATELKAQKNISIISIIGIILLSGLLYSQWRLYQKTKAQNIIISKANDEKNILLKEIHHRVKNNLQVISSLLKLQSKYIKDDTAVKAIAEGRSRVQSMALLHQNLYQDDNLKGVNMKDYFTNLIQGLFDAYNIEEDAIALQADIDPLVLDVDTVIPLGLITNELISNALKHAFTSESNGVLKVSLKEVNKTLILTVSDNGIGKKSPMDPNAKSGFGKMLIQSLSSKLEAEIVERQDNGTSIEITIHDYKVAA